MLSRSPKKQIDIDGLRARLANVKHRALVDAEQHYKALRLRQREEEAKHTSLIQENFYTLPVPNISARLAEVESVLATIKTDVCSAKVALDQARSAAWPAVCAATAPVKRDAALIIEAAADAIDEAEKALRVIDGFVSKGGFSGHTQPLGFQLPDVAALRNFARRLAAK